MPTAFRWPAKRTHSDRNQRFKNSRSSRISLITAHRVKRQPLPRRDAGHHSQLLFTVQELRELLKIDAVAKSQRRKGRKIIRWPPRTFPLGFLHGGIVKVLAT